MKIVSIFVAGTLFLATSAFATENVNNIFDAQPQVEEAANDSVIPSDDVVKSKPSTVKKSAAKSKAKKTVKKSSAKVKHKVKAKTVKHVAKKKPA